MNIIKFIILLAVLVCCVFIIVGTALEITNIITNKGINIVVTHEVSLEELEQLKEISVSHNVNYVLPEIETNDLIPDEIKGLSSS